MHDHRVACDRCGSMATLIATEGEFFPPQGRDHQKVFQTIDCPNCGQLEQELPPGDFAKKSDRQCIYWDPPLLLGEGGGCAMLQDEAQNSGG